MKTYNPLTGTATDQYIKTIMVALADESVQTETDLLNKLKAFDEACQNTRLEQALSLVGQVRAIRSAEDVDKINGALASVKGL